MVPAGGRVQGGRTTESSGDEEDVFFAKTHETLQRGVYSDH